MVSPEFSTKYSTQFPKKAKPTKVSQKYFRKQVYSLFPVYRLMPFAAIVINAGFIRVSLVPGGKLSPIR